MRSKQRLTLPVEFSNELAEETGIHIGDGSMNRYESNGKTHWEYTHSSHAIDDEEYRIYVRRLMKHLYNLEPHEKTRHNGTSLVYPRKDLVLFKKRIGLPIGKKWNVEIPSWVLRDISFKQNCIRGIVDTDGCLRFRKPFKGTLHSYPELKITSTSKGLVNQIKVIFLEFGLVPYVYQEKISLRRPNTLYNVVLNGVPNIKRYLRIFGFSNMKHHKKYLFWKQYGFYTKSAFERMKMPVTGFEPVVSA